LSKDTQVATVLKLHGNWKYASITDKDIYEEFRKVGLTRMAMSRTLSFYESTDYLANKMS